MTILAKAAKMRPAARDNPFEELGAKTNGLHRYLSGPHFRDYYLLLDEQAEHIFDMRVAAHIREIHGIGNEHADRAAARLLEIWIDDTEKHVWYVFEASRSDEATDSH